MEINEESENSTQSENSSQSENSCQSENLSSVALFDGKLFRITESRENFEITAQCQLCRLSSSIKYIRGRSNVTSNFIKHIKLKHNKEYTEYLEYKTEIKNSKKRKSTTINADDASKPKLLKQLDVKSSFALGKKVTQLEFDNKLIKFLINSMSALSIIENSFFIELFNGFDVKVMSRSTAVRKITFLAEDIEAKIKKKLEGVEYVCTTADIWSAKKRSFLGMTCHWIDVITLERKSAALACQRFTGYHTYDKIAELIYEIHTKFELSDGKICSTITDNGSNFVKAFKAFGVEISNPLIINSVAPNLNSDEENSGDEDMEDLIYLPEIDSETEAESTISLHLPKHQRCFSHTINLIATTDLAKLMNISNVSRGRHTNIMNKCSQLWNKAGRPKSAEIIKEILDHHLSYPGITRWNSYYDAIQQLLADKEKLPLLYEKLLIKQYSLKENDFEYLGEYVEVLKPLDLALDILQGQNNLFYGYIIPTIASMKIKLQKLKAKNFKNFSSVLDGLIEAVNRRFNHYITFKNLDVLLATISHPTFKFKWTKLFQEMENIENIKANLKQSFVNAVNFASTELTTESVTVEPQKIQLDEFFEFGDNNEDDHFLNDSHTSSILQGGQGELQALQYLQDLDTNLEMLNKYPFVKKIFLKYNTTLPSSAPVERMFSYATFINVPRRHALSDKNFENLVVLKANHIYF